MKLNKKLTKSGIGLLGCFGLLGVFAVVMLCPFQSDGVNADDTAVLSNNVNVASVVSVALENTKVSVDVTPKSAGVPSVTGTVLTVSTNNRSGYSVYMSTGSGESTLKNTNPAITDKIGPMASESTLAAAAANTWGYNLAPCSGTCTLADASTALFKPVPATAGTDAVVAPDTGSLADKYQLSFGSKVDTNIASGTYNNTIVVSAVAKPNAVNDLSELIYMQDMTHQICANTPGNDGAATVAAGQEPTRQLIDTRDGKLYYVAKLADQNCWMTQNLDLDITPGMISAGSLNQSSTDIGWTGQGTAANTQGTVWSGNPSASSSTDGMAACGTNSFIDASQNSDNVKRNCVVVDGKARYIPTATNIINQENQLSGVAGDTTQTNTMSWDLGKYVLAHPLWGQSCGTTAKWMGDCTQVGFYDVSDPAKWSPTYDSAADAANAGKTGKDYMAIKCTAGAEAFNAEGTALTSYCTAGEYDPHYLIGNYYQYNTATAGSGGTITNANATNSICPKGWKMATSGRDAEGKPLLDDGSFAGMLSRYGFRFEEKSEYSWDGYYGSSVQNDYDVVKLPFFIFHSGLMDAHRWTITLANGHGDFWSKGSSQVVSGAYNLNNNNGNNTIKPAYESNRNSGYSLRCLAR